MFYISQILPNGIYGVTDTDDNSEEFYDYATILHYTNVLNIEIKGVEPYGILKYYSVPELHKLVKTKNIAELVNSLTVDRVFCLHYSIVTKRDENGTWRQNYCYEFVRGADGSFYCRYPKWLRLDIDSMLREFKCAISQKDFTFVVKEI